MTAARLRPPLFGWRGVLVLSVMVGFGVTRLLSGVGVADGQAAGPAAVVQQFFDALNRGDAAGAAALFSESGTFTGADNCRETCSDKSDIQMVFADFWVPHAPFTFAIEQQCGDIVAVRVQGSNGSAALVGSDRWGVGAMRISEGRILAAETLYPYLPTLAAAQRAAIQACGGQYLPASPAPFNRGGLVSIDTRLTLWLGAMLLSVVATAVIALLLHIGRRLRGA